jgi:hypothetical protein
MILFGKGVLEPVVELGLFYMVAQLLVLQTQHPLTIVDCQVPFSVRLATKVVNTVSVPVPVWSLEWSILVLVNSSVLFRVYRHFIYLLT